LSTYRRGNYPTTSASCAIIGSSPYTIIPFSRVGLFSSTAGCKDIKVSGCSFLGFVTGYSFRSILILTHTLSQDPTDTSCLPRKIDILYSAIISIPISIRGFSLGTTYRVIFIQRKAGSPFILIALNTTSISVRIVTVIFLVTPSASAGGLYTRVEFG
jgi:hypothetical protein